MQLEDGFMEFIVAKCINGKRIGEGNCAVDIIKDDIGIDVSCTCLNGNFTNEKSLMQNFKLCGNDLDMLFTNKKMSHAINLYKKCYNKN